MINVASSIIGRCIIDDSLHIERSAYEFKFNSRMRKDVCSAGWWRTPSSKCQDHLDSSRSVWECCGVSGSPGKCRGMLLSTRECRECCQVSSRAAHCDRVSVNDREYGRVTVWQNKKLYPGAYGWCPRLLLWHTFMIDHSPIDLLWSLTSLADLILSFTLYFHIAREAASLDCVLSFLPTV